MVEVASAAAATSNGGAARASTGVISTYSARACIEVDQLMASGVACSGVSLIK